MSGYPPGVTGSEPQITGEYPCATCDGRGWDGDEDGKHGCWFCGGTGIAPEDPPDCPECGDSNTIFLCELPPDHDEFKNTDSGDAIFCYACEVVA